MADESPPPQEVWWNPQITQKQIDQVRDSCPFIVATHSIIGFGFGGLMGLFFSSLGASSPETTLFMGDRSPITGQLYPTTRAQVVATFKEMGRSTWSSAKGFGKVAALFSASECAIESYRAKNDIYNTLGAGCFSGAALATKGTIIIIHL
jgi:mitochondrial import inner membrane translocase subunit TIM22